MNKWIKKLFGRDAINEDIHRTQCDYSYRVCRRCDNIELVQYWVTILNCCIFCRDNNTYIVEEVQNVRHKTKWFCIRCKFIYIKNGFVGKKISYYGWAEYEYYLDREKLKCLHCNRQLLPFVEEKFPDLR